MKLIFLGTLVGGRRCATSWCDLDLIFDLAIVTLSVKVLSCLSDLEFYNLVRAISQKL